jgi:uncharacterized protein YjdB
MGHTKSLSTGLLILALALFLSCDGISLYDFALQGAIGPDEKTFSSFSLAGSRGRIDNATMTISVTLPVGTDVSSLAPTFTLRGDRVQSGETIVTSGTVALNFSSPLVLTVYAKNETWQNYTVTVTFTTTIVPVTGVSLSQSTMGILVGANQQLVATVLPSNATNRNVTWSSNYQPVAEVNDTGIVTGNAPGTARITVTTADGGFIATCDVAVSSSVVEATGFVLNPSSLVLLHNESDQLTCTIEPSNSTYQAITWVTSDPAVVSVSGAGAITGAWPGSATITASLDGTSLWSECTVTVERVFMGIQANITSLAMGTNSTSAQISVEAIYSNGAELLPVPSYLIIINTVPSLIATSNTFDAYSFQIQAGSTAGTGAIESANNTASFPLVINNI